MSRIKGPDQAQDPNHELERLVLRYQQPLLRTCFLYLRDRALAEDAVQETFLKAYRSLASFRGECSEKTWLMKIAMNTCCDLRRAHRLRRIDPRRIPDLLPQTAEPFTQAEEALGHAGDAAAAQTARGDPPVLLSGHDRNGNCRFAGHLPIVGIREAEARQGEAARAAGREGSL